jgi:hypothetical protein
VRDNNLQRLINLARRGRERSAAEAEPPFGFATRIAARALAGPREDSLALLDRMARWSLALAVLVCVATAVTLERREASSSALADFAGLNEPVGRFW